jgi:hypothetical protein
MTVMTRQILERKTTKETIRHGARISRALSENTAAMK